MLKRIYYFLTSGTFFSRLLCTLLFLGGIVLISLPLANRMTADQVANIPKYLPAGSNTPVGDKKPRESKLGFEANSGQISGHIKYLAKVADYSLFFTSKDVVFRRTQDGELRMQFAGGARSPRVRGEDLLDVAKGTPSFGRVVYEGIYKDIDAAFHGDRNSLDYDLVVAPGTDPKVISIGFKGASQTSIENDLSVVIKIGFNTIRSTISGAFQGTGGERRAVNCRYIEDPQTGNIGFEIGEFDPGKPLIIGQRFIL